MKRAKWRDSPFCIASHKFCSGQICPLQNLFGSKHTLSHLVLDQKNDWQILIVVSTYVIHDWQPPSTSSTVHQKRHQGPLAQCLSNVRLQPRQGKAMDKFAYWCCRFCIFWAMRRNIAGWHRDWWLAQAVVTSTVFDVNLRHGLWWVVMWRSMLFPVIRSAAVVNHSGSGLAASSHWIVGWELVERRLVVHPIVQRIDPMAATVVVEWHRGRSSVGSMGMGSASVGCGWSVTRKNSAWKFWNLKLRILGNHLIILVG